MDLKPKVCVLKTEGINCDRETRYAFQLVGADAEIVHINSLIKGYNPVTKEKVALGDYHILALPGGFSHGDYVAAGKVFAQYLIEFLGEEVRDFISKGKPVIGICNGFQVEVKAGLLPNLDGEFKQTTTLTYNDNLTFQNRWVKLVSPENKCIWTRGIKNIDLPVAHGEGRFFCSEEHYRELLKRGLIVFQYADSDLRPTMQFPENPNKSMEAIAGICDPSGLIFGLMPHPERYNHPKNHHLATLQEILSRDYIDRGDSAVAERIKCAGVLPKEGSGLQIFRNGVEHVIENLL